jgi:hypothetical protein
VGGTAAGLREDRPRRLAAHDHAVLSGRGLVAALEAQAGVPSREALDVGDAAGPPLLVAHEQQRHLGVRLGPRRERPHRADRQHHAALHVDAAGADELVAVAVQRPVVAVPDHGVHMAEQQHAPRAGPAQARDEVLGMVGRRAGDALDLGGVGQQRGTHRGALLGAVHVAGRRRHADQSLELARRPPPDLRCRRLHPWVHEAPR